MSTEEIDRIEIVRGEFLTIYPPRTARRRGLLEFLDRERQNAVRVHRANPTAENGLIHAQRYSAQQDYLNNQDKRMVKLFNRFIFYW